MSLTTVAVTATAAAAISCSLIGVKLVWREPGIAIVLDPAKVYTALLLDQSPFTGRPWSSLDAMDTRRRHVLVSAVKAAWPEWYANVLTAKIVHQRSDQQLLQSSDKQLGAGQFGTVHDSCVHGHPVAIKKVEHARNGGSGHNEAYVMNALKERLLIPRVTSGIVWLYKYLPGSLSTPTAPTVPTGLTVPVARATGSPRHAATDSPRRVNYDLTIMERANGNLWSKLGASSKPKLKWLKSVLFQVLHTLAKLQQHDPGFRHNDLKTDNVLLFESRVAESPLEYLGLYYQLGAKPSSKVTLAKLTDFDFACTSLISNAKVDSAWSSAFGCESTPNHFYDAHLFLNSVYRHASALPKEVVAWIESVIPTHLRGDRNTKFLKFGRLVTPKDHAGELKTAGELVVSPFFEVFKMKKPVAKTGLTPPASVVAR